MLPISHKTLLQKFFHRSDLHDHTVQSWVRWNRIDNVFSNWTSRLGKSFTLMIFVKTSNRNNFYTINFYSDLNCPLLHLLCHF